MFLYRLLLSLAAPWFVLRLWREGGGAARQRLGGGAARAPADRPVWLHAASNGELTAARPLIDALRAAAPGTEMLVTCNSATGLALARGWALPGTEVRLAPFDFRFALRRFIRAWRPRALILIESELWPNRMLMMARSGAPVIILSARMSERSAALWKRLPRLSARILETVTFLSAQDDASARRFRDLGLPADRLGGVLNLKTDAGPGSFDAAEKARLSAVYDRANTVLAASTHDGEEAEILRAFRMALAERPELRLILAPRHPRRSRTLQRLIAESGLRFATRSAGQVPGPDTQVFLADTLGEMPLWYDLSGIAFVGGSLVARGGHTPFEPAAHGCALIHGPHLENFAEIYSALENAQASIRVSGAEDLGRALISLDGAAIARMSDRARAVIAGARQDDELAALVARLVDLTR